MLYLILFGLIVSFAVVGRRYWMLRRGVDRLSEAVAQRKSFLNDTAELPRLHRAWQSLVNECSSLVHEVDRLKHQRAGHLTQLEMTLGNLQESVVIVDRANSILLANRATRTIFPTAREVLGQRIEIILHSADFLSYLEDVRANRAISRKEIEFIEPGRSVWIEATGALIPETREDNGPWALFVLHDVTRQKQLENLRREFVANVSHELKTPLSVIKGYAETLADDHETMGTSDREQFIRTIYRHAERLAAIVEDLLTLSRLESGNPDVRRSTHPIAEFIRSTADEFTERLANSGHELVVASGPGGIDVEIDPLRLTQVFANLIDNAQKYTPRGSRIEIGYALQSSRRELHVWVQDNGPGIPTADLPRIFERFFRVEKGRSREKGGTGLGLSIVKHIVHMHGGQVWAESEVGRGTRIIFSLPLSGGRPAVEPSAARLDSNSAATAHG